MPGSTHYRAGHRRIPGLVLPVLLFEVIVEAVVHLLMLTAAYPGDRCPSRCAGNRAAGAAAGLRIGGAGAARVAGLGLAFADVLLNGLLGLALERNDRLGCNAEAHYRAERGYIEGGGFVHGGHCSRSKWVGKVNF
ncbi:hypothetical protein D9M68_900480 [compost metagenome]